MPRKQYEWLPRIVRRLLATHRLNLWLGLAVAVANVLGYAAVVIISASFGPAAFGAVGALTSLGVITGIPAGTLMVIVAGRTGVGENVPWAYALSVAVGVIEWMLIVAGSLVMMRVFDLDSAWPLFWLGLTLIPMTMVGAQQGVLLGSNRLGRLSVLFVFSGVARLAAALMCVLVKPTVSVAYFAWLIAAILGFVLGYFLCRDLASLHGRLRGLIWQAAALGRASLALLALITLTSIDTIFARHFLNPYESGIYSVASMFAKVIFWGTQFIAMIVIPRLAQRSERFLILKAYGAVVLLGLPVVIAVAVDPLFWLASVGLQDYNSAAVLLVRFSALGMLWSLTQVSIFADISGAKTQMTTIVWVGLALQILLTSIWLHSTPADVWLAAFVSAAFVTIAALLRMAFANDRRSRVGAPP